MSRRLFLFALMLITIFTMAATSPTQGMILVLAPLIMAVISPLIIRIFRKMGIEIEDSLIDPVLMKLIELIAKVEPDGGSGEEKKMQVVNLARRSLAKKDIKILEKRYGSLETAVQAAYENSSIAMR